MTIEEQAVASAEQAEDEEDWDTKIREWREDRDRRFREIRHDARAVFKTVGRWGGLRDEAEWHAICEKARTDYASGRFLIEQLGAEQYIYPELMATIWKLRQGLLDQFDTAGPAEEMLVDLAILGYYNTLRIQGWIGNSATLIEAELFGQESPTAKFKERYGYGAASGLKVEEMVQGLVQTLFPLLDRCNRMFIRNLRAIKDLRAPAGPAVAIGAAGQVNVGTQQVNAVTATSRAEPVGDGARSRGRRERGMEPQT